MNRDEPKRPALHVLTFPSDAAQPPEQNPCTGGYLCDCSECEAETALRAKQGVRRDRSDPFRNAA